MIREIKVENFKCFENFTLPLKSVNVLTGVNGMGKSTIIQSLLLIRQSIKKSEGMKGLYLNGEYTSLGNGQDILYEKAEDDKIGLGYMDETGEYFWEYQYLPDSDYLPTINSVGKMSLLQHITNHFSYLSAYRIQPQELYGIRNEEDINNREFGNNGEFALQYLGIHGDDLVENSNVILEDKLGKTLRNQTRLWLDRISPGVSPQITINMSLRKSEVRYEFIEGTEKTKSYKSINVGFGITYVLPLIIALLSAKKGDIIVRLTTPYTAVLIDETTAGMVISSNFVVIRIESQAILPEYLFWLLNTQSVKHDIYENATSNMLGAVNAKFLAEIEVAVLPIKDQYKLAQIYLASRHEIRLLKELYGLMMVAT